MYRFFNSILIKIVFSLILIAGMVSNGVDFGTASMIVGGLMLLTLVPAGAVDGVVARDEVLSRLFSSDLQEKLWPANEFYSGCRTDPNVALDQEKIEIPQDENGYAHVHVNPKEFPLRTRVEKDAKKEYGTDLIATDPQLVTDLNQALVSYDKRAAKLRKHQNSLLDVCAMKIAYSWMVSKTDFKRATTSTTNRNSAVGTGTRKKISKDDIMWARTMMNKLNIPMANRRVLIHPNMEEDLFYIDDFINSDKLRATGELANGSIGRIMGFDIYVRSETPVVAANGANKAYGAAAANDDNAVSLFYHTDMVRYAQGTPKVYIDPDNGSYLGTRMNAAVRCGGTIGRESELGVLALYEAPTA